MEGQQKGKMVKVRFYSVTIIALLMISLSIIAHHANALKEEAIAELYLKKIWIASDWSDEVYRDIYFSFDKMENRECEGGFGTGEIYRFGGSNHLREAENRFSGIVDGSIAECRFVDHDGRVGKIAFVFINENEVEATMSYEGDGTIESKTFRPYNIRDINCFTLQEESIIQVDLDHWGVVYFVAGIDEGTEYKPVPKAYLVNKNYDILCAFEPAWFHVRSKIYDVIFKDVNEDGLEDAVISTCFVDYNGAEEVGMPHLHWLFLQTDYRFTLENVWIDKGRRLSLNVKDTVADIDDIEESRRYLYINHAD